MFGFYSITATDHEGSSQDSEQAHVQTPPSPARADQNLGAIDWIRAKVNEVWRLLTGRAR